MALETENRALMRRIDARDAETAHAPHDRLASIEQRLAAIEMMLRETVAQLSRRL